VYRAAARLLRHTGLVDFTYAQIIQSSLNSNNGAIVPPTSEVRILSQGHNEYQDVRISSGMMFILKGDQLVSVLPVSQLACAWVCSIAERSVRAPAGGSRPRQVQALRDLEPVFMRQMFFPSLIKARQQEAAILNICLTIRVQSNHENESEQC
jgi:hypothetical protein